MKPSCPQTICLPVCIQLCVAFKKFSPASADMIWFQQNLKRAVILKHFVVLFSCQQPIPDSLCSEASFPSSSHSLSSISHWHAPSEPLLAAARFASASQCREKNSHALPIKCLLLYLMKWKSSTSGNSQGHFFFFSERKYNSREIFPTHFFVMRGYAVWEEQSIYIHVEASLQLS